MSRKTSCILAGAALAALLSGAAFSQERVGKDTLLGEPLAADQPVDKVVKIDSNTRWVNVVRDETVQFVAGGKNFSWHFATSKAAVNLKDIAPPGTIDRDLYVYLAPNPLYPAGD
jgi:hypothetical protein